MVEMINTSSEMVKLLCMDGQLIEESKSIVLQSGTIRGMIEDGRDLKENSPLPEITGPTMRLVIEYFKHIEAKNAAPDIEKPLKSNDMKDATTEWYADYIEKNDEIVQDIILAANYLEIKELVQLGCAKMGSIIRGMSVIEFRKRFNIVNDFTPEEEAEPFDEARLAELAEEWEKSQADAEEHKEGDVPKKEEEEEKKSGR